MSSAGRGNALPGARPTLTPQQAQELVRKQRKCVSCGNTAMGKCDFRSCGTCCTRARNNCQVHGAKQGASPVGPTISTPETPVRPPYQWPATPLGMGQQFMRPPNGQTPSPYMNPALMSYRLPYGSPVVRMPTPPPVETEAQKEARLEKARKQMIIAQKDAMIVNSWRIVRMKNYDDAELKFEDEAFDRYMLNANLLEEVAGGDAVPSEESIAELKEEELTDACMAKLDFRQRELRRQKLQKVVTKSFQKFRKRDGEAENMLEIREFNLGRRDTKRMKVQTADGKESLRRINAWEDLFQDIGSISSVGDLSLFLDSYKEAFGHDLGQSLPQLIRIDATLQTEVKQATATEELVAKETQRSSKQDEAIHEGEEPNVSSQQSIDLLQEILGEAGTMSLQQTPSGTEILTMEQLFAVGDQVVEEDPEQQSLVTEMVGELEAAVVDQQALAMHQAENVLATALEEATDEIASDEEAGNAVEQQAAEAEEQAAEEATPEVLLEQSEQIEQQIIMEAEKDSAADAGDQVEVSAEEKASRLLPVRKLVTNLIKQKPLTGAACVKVELEEQSFKRVYDNRHRYILEAL